jgi:hypothetical protein
MKARYHTQTALSHGQAASDEVAARLRTAWAEGHYDKVISELEDTQGRFDPGDHLFAGLGRRYVSSRDYETYVYDLIERDLDEALTEGGSPVKAAQEVMRILRDQLRSVIEFGGLTLDSYGDFQSNIRGRINRLEAGPPPLRSQQTAGSRFTRPSSSNPTRQRSPPSCAVTSTCRLCNDRRRPSSSGFTTKAGSPSFTTARHRSAAWP